MLVDPQILESTLIPCEYAGTSVSVSGSDAAVLGAAVLAEHDLCDDCGWCCGNVCPGYRHISAYHLRQQGRIRQIHEVVGQEKVGITRLQDCNDKNIKKPCYFSAKPALRTAEVL